MRITLARSLHLATVAAALTFGCAGHGDDRRSAPDGGAGTTSQGDATPSEEPPTFAPTLSAIYREVLGPAACTLGLCHGEGASGGGLSLFPRDAGYAHLVGAASDSEACGPLGLLRVEPGEPDRSLLVLKLDPSPPCGDPMPPHETLDPRHVSQIREWIARGARDD